MFPVNPSNTKDDIFCSVNSEKVGLLQGSVARVQTRPWKTWKNGKFQKISGKPRESFLFSFNTQGISFVKACLNLASADDFWWLASDDLKIWKKVLNYRVKNLYTVPSIQICLLFFVCVLIHVFFFCFFFYSQWQDHVAQMITTVTGLFELSMPKNVKEGILLNFLRLTLLLYWIKFI